MRTLVLGLGNPIMGDDGIGLRVVQEVRRRIGDGPGVEVVECFSAGVDLLDVVMGYDALIVVDSIRNSYPSGTVFCASLDDLPSQPATIDLHGMGILGILELGAHLGMEMPRKVSIVGISVDGDPYATDSLSPKVEQAIPESVERVLEELKCTS